VIVLDEHIAIWSIRATQGAVLGRAVNDNTRMAGFAHVEAVCPGMLGDSPA
jgi:hypothetical protein